VTVQEKRAILLRAAEGGAFVEAYERRLGNWHEVTEAAAPVASAILGESVKPDELWPSFSQPIGNALTGQPFWAAVFKVRLDD
jgi:hypothetical protein